MNLFRRKKDGPWYVRFRHPVTGKDTWRCTKTTDRKTAELIGKSLEVQIARQEFGLEPKDTRRHMPLSAFIKTYMQYSETNKASSTASVDRSALSEFLRIVGDKSITQFQPTDFEYFKAMRSKEVSPGSVNVNLRAIKAAFHKAVQWGFLDKSPTSGVALMRKPKSPPKYLTDEEIEKLLATDHAQRPNLDQEFGKLIRFFLLTGLRRNELRHLEWTDIDLKKGLLYVRNKAIFRTKTDASEREIPISPTLRKLIEDIGPKQEGLIFPSPNGGPYSYTYWSHKFKDRIRRAGLDDSYSLHTLRHTFATHLRDKGVGLDIIGKLLGHTNLETTRIYGHLTPSNVRSAISLLMW